MRDRSRKSFKSLARRSPSLARTRRLSSIRRGQGPKVAAEVPGDELGKPEQRGQRGAQFVGHGREEGAFDLVHAAQPLVGLLELPGLGRKVPGPLHHQVLQVARQPLQVLLGLAALGVVPGHEHEAGRRAFLIVDAGDPHGVAPPGPVPLHGQGEVVAAGRRDRVQAPAHGPQVHAGLDMDLAQVPAGQDFGRGPENLPGRRIDVGDAPGLVRSHDPHLGAAQQVVEKHGLLDQGLADFAQGLVLFGQGGFEGADVFALQPPDDVGLGHHPEHPAVVVHHHQPAHVPLLHDHGRFEDRPVLLHADHRAAHDVVEPQPAQVGAVGQKPDHIAFGDDAGRTAVTGHDQAGDGPVGHAPHGLVDRDVAGRGHHLPGHDHGDALDFRQGVVAQPLDQVRLGEHAPGLAGGVDHDQVAQALPGQQVVGLHQHGVLGHRDHGCAHEVGDGAVGEVLALVGRGPQNVALGDDAARHAGLRHDQAGDAALAHDPEALAHRHGGRNGDHVGRDDFSQAPVAHETSSDRFPARAECGALPHGRPVRGSERRRSRPPRCGASGSCSKGFSG